MRFTALLLMFPAAAFAQTANVTMRYFLGYGNEEFAQLNGASVGSKLRADAPVRVANLFTVQLWAEVVEKTHDYYGTTLSSMVAFDRAWGKNANPQSAVSFLDRKIELANDLQSMRNFGSIELYDYTYPDTFVSGGPWTFSPLSLGKAAFVGTDSADATQTLRAAGIGAGFAGTTSGGPGELMALGQPGHRFRIFDLDLKSNLNVGEIYGDDSAETGLQTPESLATGPAAGGGTRNNRMNLHLGPPNTPNPESRSLGAKYVVVGAVPEPSSLLAFAAGAGFLLRRRRTSDS